MTAAAGRTIELRPGVRVAARGAQLVYTQISLHRWIGRLLNPRQCVDVRRDPPRVVTWTPFYAISESVSTGIFIARSCGCGDSSGARHANFPTLDAAQQSGLQWAARRFVILTEESHRP